MGIVGSYCKTCLHNDESHNPDTGICQTLDCDCFEFIEKFESIEEYPVVFMYEGVESRITDKQREALKINAQKWRGIQVGVYSPYGLPEGYINVVLDPNRHPIYGGMDKDGIIST